MKRRAPKREEEKIRMLSRQYERLQRAWSENAMLFHDMENHLQTIHHLARTEGNEEICAYIARISKPVEQLTGVFWTGVGIVDAVLNAKKQLAGEKGYRLDINAQLPANTGIAEDDLCTVLTNLLDNAIESMDREKDSLEKRYGKQAPGAKGVSEPSALPENAIPPIEVSLRHIHHFVVIRVSNPCTAEQAGRHSFLATVKRDRMRHGWGLKSVRRAVQKYNGSLSLEADEGRFVALAMLFFVP